MPAHISHLLFAEDVLRQAVPNAGGLLERAGNLFRCGAQGPDIFYHSQRTRPVALRHPDPPPRVWQHGGAHGADGAHHGAAHRDRGPAASRLSAGLPTHAELDRHTHPYIICRAGWVRRQDPASERFRRCHTFLERLLDVAALRVLRSQELRRVGGERRAHDAQPHNLRV